ncbi:MAG TPA: FAD-dependent oxidoreductase [Thermoproteales archaeon]|nr:FAD-dependent oxidoreductase [Thermoproteales archaeon]
MSLPLESKKYDVVVIGGGLAGICAAIAAARHGVKTALIEARPVLGGNSSSLIRVNPGGAAAFNPWARETGIIEEMLIEHQKRTHLPLRNGLITSQWDLVLYEWVKKEENLDLYLNTYIFEVYKEGNRIKSVKGVQIGSEKLFEFFGKIFIDCTGDATVGYLAGAEYRIGRESQYEFNENPVHAPEKADNKTQGSSILFKSVDVGKPVKYEPPPWAIKYPDEQSLYKRHHPPRILPDGSKIYSGYWWIEIGAPYNTISDNEEIRDELLKHVLGVWDHIKNYGEHEAETLALEWVGFIPGKRESRRLIGDYILTEHDLKNQTLFPDRVAYGGWMIDVHTMGGILAKDKPPEPLAGDEDLSDIVVVEPYSIPLRSLYSRNIENLMMAGRDISATHVAMGSTRLMLTGAVMGQAVGTAAALCVKYKITPRELALKKIKELQQILLKDDAFIIGVVNEDPGDMARNARVEASSHLPLILEPNGREIELVHDIVQVFPISDDKISDLKLHARTERSVKIKMKLSPIDSIWSLNKPKEPIKIVELSLEKGLNGWINIPFNVTVEPKRLYRIEIPATPGVFLSLAKPLPGVCLGWKKPYWRRYRSRKDSLALRLKPISYPFTPDNIVNGYARPYNWTNIWISNEGFPQTVLLDLGRVRKFNTIYLTFDTNLNVEYNSLPPFYVFPECVKNYTVEISSNGSEFETVVEVKGNYQRRRIHRFQRKEARYVRITVHESNGDPFARIYEVRVYDE